VLRDKHGYQAEEDSEDDDEEDEEEASSEESEYQESENSSSGSSQPKAKSRRSQDKHSPATSDQQRELRELRQQIDDQRHHQNDTTELLRGLIANVRSLSESVKTLSVPPATITVTPSTSRLNPSLAQESRERQWPGQPSAGTSHAPGPSHPAEWHHSPILYQHRGTDPGDQNFPELEDKDLAVASAFEKHKKAYKEYYSKCLSYRRTPVTLARTFEKWSEWIAVIFTEQEKQRSEAQGSEHRTFFVRDSVLRMSDEEFEQRYMAMCGITMKDPSQVLDFLRTPEVDVSTCSINGLFAASESFRRKLRQIPAVSLHATTAERVRNAYIESLFGEDRGRRKRVDFDQMDTWEEVALALSRAAARAQNGQAYEPFPTLPEFKGKGKKQQQPKKRDDDESSEADSTRSKRAKEDEALCRGCDMRITSEKKWYKRYRYFTHQNKIPMDQHGGASSWRERYVHVVDLADRKSGRCTLCEARGHVASKCDNPQPDVLYPSPVDSKGSASPGRRDRGIDRGDSESRSTRRSDEKAYRRPEERDERRYDDRNDRRYDDRGGRRQDDRGGRRHDERSHSRDRDRYGDQRYGDFSQRRYDDRGRSPARNDQRNYEPSNGRHYSPARPDRHTDDSRQYERPRTPEQRYRDSAQPAPSTARSSSRPPESPRDRARSPSGESRQLTCYRCGEEGHVQRDCKATKDRDGRTI
jgi:hypothetical protein